MKRLRSATESAMRGDCVPNGLFSATLTADFDVLPLSDGGDR